VLNVISEEVVLGSFWLMLPGLGPSDVISGGLLSNLGPLCLALGANR